MYKSKIKLHFVGRIDPKVKWKIRNHSHAFHEMIIITSGEMSVLIGNKNINAKAKDVLFYSAGVEHKEQPSKINPVEAIYINWERKDKEKTEIPVLTHDNDGRIRLLVKWLFQEWQFNSKYNIQFQEAVIETIVAECLRLSKIKKGTSEFIWKIRNFMRDNIKEKISLEKLANYADLNKYHFLQKYEKLTGRTPMEDLRILRIDMAEELILTTNLPLKVIARETGFANEHHFSKIFSKYSGTTPGHLHKFPLA
ncbi:MAG: AraC family transcriptional regulator [Elusimicrobia bacterium]|nr:AraC family transcriptional regulator [Elusimicrobiota bacterium]